MTTRYIDVDDGKWGIIVVYDFDERDHDSLYAIMRTFGMSRPNIRKSIGILMESNSGMAVSRDDLRMSVVFISPTTSISQFWNSVSHELFHVEQAILDYYDQDYAGEPPAYLSGYLLQKVVETID